MLSSRRSCQFLSSLKNVYDQTNPYNQCLFTCNNVQFPDAGGDLRIDLAGPDFAGDQ